eukprot:COSAG02_NODE_14631_length_1252_cov_9.076240_3_plen_156_part_00
MLGGALEQVVPVVMGDGGITRVEGPRPIATTNVSSPRDAPAGATVYLHSPHECYGTVIGHLAYTTGDRCIGIGSAKLPGMAMSLKMDGARAQGLLVLKHDDDLFEDGPSPSSPEDVHVPISGAHCTGIQCPGCAVCRCTTGALRDDNDDRHMCAV